MTFKIGTEIYRVVSVWVNGKETREIKREKITRVSPKGDLVWTNNDHKAEDGIFPVYCFPAEDPNSLIFLEMQQAMIARHKKEEGELMDMTYKLLNEQTRKGLR